MEHQIKNMAEDILQEYTNCYSEVDQEHLEKMLRKLAFDVQATTIKKTIDAIKSKGVRNAYSCMISGTLRETYTIKGSDLDEIEKEMLGYAE